MNKLPFNKILAISAHTDDMEFGCGATVNRLIRQQSAVYSAVFSICEDSVPGNLPKDILLEEMHDSAKVLGIPADRIYVYKFPVRKFPQFRQEILEEMVKLQKSIRPDLVLTHSTLDIHQDHKTVAEETIRAFRDQTVFGYELPWNNLTFTSNTFIQVTDADLDVKIKAIACYKSQAFRHYKKDAMFHSHARLRGIQCRKDLAEAFETIRVAF